MNRTALTAKQTKAISKLSATMSAALDIFTAQEAAWPNWPLIVPGAIRQPTIFALMDRGLIRGGSEGLYLGFTVA